MSYLQNIIKGRVVHGNGIGKSQGYATANLELDSIKSESGVFAAKTKCFGKMWDSALVIAENKIEVYLFDYTGEDFYGEILEVEPLEKVSEVVRFDSIGELKSKIEVDLKKIKELLRR
jgi:riboflavin kinase / FMN adenylyltransferase